MLRVFFVVSLLVLISRSSPKNDLQIKIKEIFQSELNKEDIHTGFLAIYSANHNINWNFAGGEFQDGTKVTRENPFYCASIGKTFTATAISILKEQGKLNFNDKIYQYLSKETIHDLHVFEGKDYSNQITIAQLLQHTSGLPDYFEGNTKDGSPNAMQLIFQDTAKFWKPADMINLSKKMKPLFIPGEGFNYTDTEYVLLGLIIENLTKMPLHDFFKENIFEPSGMKYTFMYKRSKPIKSTGKMAEIWVGDYCLDNIMSLTADWAGGGLVSTAEDLNLFYSALNSGILISDSTLREMKNWVPETKGMYYGFGIRKIDFFDLFQVLPGIYAEGHTGTPESYMFYSPKLDLYISGTFNQSEEAINSIEFISKILSVFNTVLNEK